MAISATASPSGPTGCSILSSGDRQKMDPAQAMDGNLGKVLRLTAEGAPAPGNPLRRRAGSPRNSGRSATATCSASPSRPTAGCGRPRWGPKGGDELNLIERGQELRLADRLERQPL